MCKINNKIFTNLKEKFNSDPIGLVLILSILFLFTPLLLCIVYAAYSIIQPDDWKFSLPDEALIKEFFKKHFFPFSWYSQWLSVLYNITAVLGLAVAAMTYYKNNKSQASINHFANVQLFRDYAQQEISKTNRLIPASFDLMSWYSYIYPQSKQGILFCSNEYQELMRECNKLIESSNFSARNQSGFKYLNHQNAAKALFRSLGINIKETNRLGYFEVEEEIIFLIEKINATFPTEAKISKFTKRSYK
ncbi:retron Ec48 family effector membrane protein [Comamonas sp.]|uniref:retron Ec48 family effector membrane protein n=1 Tax=Comamonas sp. TaxID=34028 RepID=UPI0028B10FA3|nr:retron Ec48 family effector membrane protein [Comamonas sp.]